MFLYLRWNLGVSGVLEIYSIPIRVKKLCKETQGEESHKGTSSVSPDSRAPALPTGPAEVWCLISQSGASSQFK